jgi:hypothetical protein
MAEFTEKRNEKAGQRRKRFLAFLRSQPMPDGKYDHKLKKWIPNPMKPGNKEFVNDRGVR